MAAEADEAAIVRGMFGTASDDEEEEFEEEVKANCGSHPLNDVYETSNGIEFRGLKNQGATCYLNALLQSLYFTPELREGIYALTPEELGDIKENKEEAKALDDMIAANKYELADADIARLISLGYTSTRAKRALVKAENKFEKAQLLLETKQVPSVKKILIKLRQFFSLLSSSTIANDAVSTKELTDAFGWVSREVRIQHDAHELNRILIDAIERSLKGTKHESLINSIYLGQMVSRTLCLKCEYCSQRKENFLDAIVQVQNLKTLHESLSVQCKSEYLVGDNQYFCEKCNAKCDAKRSVAYTKLPNVLTLALNRFVFNLYTMNREKCTTKFEFPLIFDFEPFLDDSLASKQTHRTKEDEELLAKANDEYQREKQRKKDIEERKKKDIVESKISQMSKAPLAIEAPPAANLNEPVITKGTHTQIAPMALPQSEVNNLNHNTHNGNGITQWRNQIPRSRSQEDEDVQRAIAESLGQVYVAPPPKPQQNYHHHINNVNSRINPSHAHNPHNPHNHAAMNLNQEPFEAQPVVAYARAVDILLEGRCCFGLYDKKIKQWRTAVFMKKWDDKKRLMVRFTQDTNINPSASSDKFLTIKDFPCDYIMEDAERFNVKERDLSDMSNVPKENIVRWAQRQKQQKNNENGNNKSKKKREKEKADKERKEREREAEAEAARKELKEAKARRDKEEKERKEREEKAAEKEREELAAKKQEKMKSIEETKETETEATEEEEEKKEKEKEEKIEDWSKRTDFSGVSLVGFLCDDGEVIQGDCLRQKPGKIFVHFNTDAGHFGKKYDWITIPNERICPPPKTRPKQTTIGFSREMTTYAISGGGGGGGVARDYGSRDESSVIGGSQWNRNRNQNNKNAHSNNHHHNNGWKLNKIEINMESKHLYALTGVVIHRGTPHAGHYHAYLKDFMKEGKYQKKKKEKVVKSEKKEETEIEIEKTRLIDAICDSALWYDFNDSSVYRIPSYQLAKQYGGGASYDECAYMLVYRKINRAEAREVMRAPNVELPSDLVAFVAAEEAKAIERRKAAEAKQNEIRIQIVDPSCFVVNADGKLTMNPFIESLLKKIIRLSREKEQIDRVINNNNEKKTEKENAEPEAEAEAEEEENKDADICALYAAKAWPHNMSSLEIGKIVTEHYKQNSVFITCDARDSVDKLMDEMRAQFAEVVAPNIELHFISVPSVFQDDAIECKSISDLFDCNIGGNIDDRLYPIYSFDDASNKNTKETDDEYPYHRKPSIIRDLPLKNLDFMLHSRACFVWNGSDINGVSFNLRSARTVDISVKYLRDNTQLAQVESVTVSIGASLDEIWSEMVRKFEIVSADVLPVFTLLTTSSKDWPDIIYNNHSKYDAEFYSKAKFAKLLHHKINPMKRWRSMKYGHNNNRRPRSNSDPNHNRSAVSAVSASVSAPASDSFWGDPILCVENALNLPQPGVDTMASQQWQESTKFSTILIDDYTQIIGSDTDNDKTTDEKEEKEYKRNEDIGSSHAADVKMRKLTWRIPKGTSLEKFFEIARTRCAIPSFVDLRAFRVYDSERYLITFPYKFQLKEHALILERGRYPKYNEIFLMVCVLKVIQSDAPHFLPLIVDRSKSIKYLKQEILKLFGLNASPSATYKKYVCYNVTAGIHERNQCWRDSQTLNSAACNPRHGDRIGIQIGVDLIQKSIVIMSDTRNLTKISFDDESNSDLIEQNSGYPYFKQECGILGIAGDATYDTLREQICCMPQIKQLMQFEKENQLSHKNLLLSWYDHIYHIPLSFPMLKSGKLQNQKNFNSSRSIICVEIVKDEAIQSIHKNARFLHIHLAKFTDNNNNNNDNNDICFWPNDNHLRIIYTEPQAQTETETIAKSNNKDKITYKHLSQFICDKYSIDCEHLLIAMFKINRGEWVIVNDSADNTPQGLSGAPFHITKTNRHGQIFAIFNLKESKITHDPLQNIAKWRIPPLSNKARFHYKHFNQQNTSSSSINAISKGITNNKSSYNYHADRQLKITNID